MLAKKSVLDFTHKEGQDEKFQLLDVKLNNNFNRNFLTSNYIKPTDYGLYTNVASQTHES